MLLLEWTSTVQCTVNRRSITELYRYCVAGIRTVVSTFCQYKYLVQVPGPSRPTDLLYRTSVRREEMRVASCASCYRSLVTAYQYVMLKMAQRHHGHFVNLLPRW